MSTATLKGFQDKLARLADQAPQQQSTDAERLKVAKQAFIDGLDGQMAVDLETCIHCGMCAEACHFYEATGDAKYTPAHKFLPLRRVYRRELSPMRWFFRPFTKDLKASELDEWQELVYDSCTGCGRCDMMCPMGINISTLINVVREGFAAAGAVPAEIGALAKQQENGNTVLGADSAMLSEVVDRIRNAGVDVKLDRAKADVLLLTTAGELEVFPDALKANAIILNSAGADWTLSSKAFEAANFGLISGNEKIQRKATQHVVGVARNCGAKTVIVPELGHAYQALRWEGANEVGSSLSFEVLAMSEFVSREMAAGRLKIGPGTNPGSVTYHDPCRLTRHGGVADPPREVLKALGFELRETESHGRENYCCGGGCGEYAIRRSSDLRYKAFKIKQKEFDETGAEQVVTSCSNCRINFMIGAEKSGWKTPVVSLVETVASRLTESGDMVKT